MELLTLCLQQAIYVSGPNTYGQIGSKNMSTNYEFQRQWLNFDISSIQSDGKRTAFIERNTNRILVSGNVQDSMFSETVFKQAVAAPSLYRTKNTFQAQQVTVGGQPSVLLNNGLILQSVSGNPVPISLNETVLQNITQICSLQDGTLYILANNQIHRYTNGTITQQQLPGNINTSSIHCYDENVIARGDDNNLYGIGPGDNGRLCSTSNYSTFTQLTIQAEKFYIGTNTSLFYSEGAGLTFCGLDLTNIRSNTTITTQTSVQLPVGVEVTNMIDFATQREGWVLLFNNNTIYVRGTSYNGSLGMGNDTIRSQFKKIQIQGNQIQNMYVSTSNIFLWGDSTQQNWRPDQALAAILSICMLIISVLYLYFQIHKFNKSKVTKFNLNGNSLKDASRKMKDILDGPYTYENSSKTDKDQNQPIRFNGNVSAKLQ